MNLSDDAAEIRKDCWKILVHKVGDGKVMRREKRFTEKRQNKCSKITISRKHFYLFCKKKNSNSSLQNYICKQT